MRIVADAEMRGLDDGDAGAATAQQRQQEKQRAGRLVAAGHDELFGAMRRRHRAVEGVEPDRMLEGGRARRLEEFPVFAGQEIEARLERDGHARRRDAVHAGTVPHLFCHHTDPHVHAKGNTLLPRQRKSHHCR